MVSILFPSRRRLVFGCVVVCVALSGCAATMPSGSESTPTMPPLEEPTACDSDLEVGFWALNEPSLWNDGELRWGGTLPATDSTYFFVGFIDGEVAGVDVESGGGADVIAVDGGRIPLDQTYEGTHTAKIVVFTDTDSDGEFAIESDQPCSQSGELVATTTQEIDFSKV